MTEQHTPGPWEYVQSTEHHGPYVVHKFGPTVCDCYTMTRPGELSARNGGASVPVHFMADEADANARLIAAAPEMFDLIVAGVDNLDFTTGDEELTAEEVEWRRKAVALIAKVRGTQ